ncbi:hypothetical protein [Anaeromicropila herbilytica]|uniref:Cupin n=1 Tax=Anaeromicropila herbilytica TaxID=2785025 RepID=A0A7R7ENM7_9FIRM|nr:hypothetical protein [Anaeromicropila herbilytica]BCN32190.1 hypothetical protein bsdtb5_34850 [Anaeromicropila herbilytica]
MENDITVSEYKEEGYKPVIDYETWRVAILRYCEELEIDNLASMQKHTLTDEIFVLLEGNCTLFSGGDGEGIKEIKSIAMEPLKLYNIKKGVWHTHTLEKETTVLIVENRNTCDDNSPTVYLTEGEKRVLRSLYV